VYAERGREGGFQLLEGYFLPPLMFTRGEAISLLLGLTLLRDLRAKPFPAEMALAEKKLLAALPDNLRSMLAQAEKMIGFEELPHDIFHPEPSAQERSAVDPVEEQGHESAIISTFLQALLDRTLVLLHYHSPYRSTSHEYVAQPLGLFWDRDHWYLVGKQADQKRPSSIWRADRVLKIKAQLSRTAAARAEFDVRELLGRQWLQAAMAQWRRNAPVTIHLTVSQARHLQEDWYYRYACFEQITEDKVAMIFGESDRGVVMELLRWLGPDAELIEPRAWREVIRGELERMLVSYRVDALDPI
jgi:predicted DNA-binding transcriptional regulator YafY